MRGVKSGRGIGIARQIGGAARTVPTSTKFACHVHHDVGYAHAREGWGFLRQWGEGYGFGTSIRYTLSRVLSICHTDRC